VKNQTIIKISYVRKHDQSLILKINHLITKSMNLKNHSLRKKLITYSAFTGSLISAGYANAQIIYTDIVPDDTLDGSGFGEFSFLDLNNDGTSDFRFLVGSVGLGGVQLAALSQASSNGQNQVHAYSGPGWGYPAPYAMNFNEAINSQNQWKLIEDEPLGAGWLVYSDGTNNFEYGAWHHVQDKYLGLRIHANGQIYYGWARLDVATALHMIIKDYAFNSAAGQTILAGQTGLFCADSFEPNNTFLQADALPLTQEVKALINQQGDADWFKFLVNSFKPNVRIVLSDLPKNYNIRLFNSLGQQVGSSNNGGTMNDTIVLNNATPGKYFAMVYGKNGQSDPFNCYTLLGETSNSPFRMNDANVNENSEAIEVTIYPNPAKNKISLLVEEFSLQHPTVIIYDITGKKVLSSNYQELNGGEKLEIDISSLNNGNYLMKIVSDKGFTIKKFVVDN
jgi:hypothetical protein